MKFVHFEVIRMGLLKKLDWSRMFAIWRVDSPWQAVTKKVNYTVKIIKILEYIFDFEYFYRGKDNEWVVAKAV